MKIILSLFACFACFAVHAVTFAWDASPSTNANAYVLYWGTNIGNYQFCTNTGTNLMVTITNRTFAGGTWYFAVTACDTNWGLESLPSNEVVLRDVPLVPSPPGMKSIDVVVHVEGAPKTSGPWTETTTMTARHFPSDNQQIYRSRLTIVKP